MTYMTTFKGIMTNLDSLHKVAILVFEGVVVGDLSVPLSLFPFVSDHEGTQVYEVGVCGHQRKIQTEFLTITAPNELSWAANADTLIIPGIHDLDITIPDDIINSIYKAWKNGCRIVSLCTGAFVLAQAGILEGCKVTTHWKATSYFLKRYKNIRYVSNVLYVDNGQILASAGATAAFDLCLHLIRKDCGDDIATTVADLAMVPVERISIQPQLNHSSLIPENDPIIHILTWIEKNICNSITLVEISEKFNLSTRTLTRMFINSVGLPPAKWITNARIKQAKNLLESSNLSIDIIAESVGYGSAEVFRENFRKISKFSPSAYRRIYRRVPNQNK